MSELAGNFNHPLAVAVDTENGRLKIVYPEPTATLPATESAIFVPTMTLVHSESLHLVADESPTDEARHLQLVTEVKSEESYDALRAANEFIDNKAPEFYGTLVLASSPTYRMRMIYKSLKKMPVVDERTKTWMESFESEKATKLGNIALETMVTIKFPADHANTPEKPPTQVTKQAQLMFRKPKIREAILNDLVLRGDSAAYVISRLEAWRKAQLEQPKESELTGSRICFDHVLFTIHEDTFPQYIETFIQAKRNELDIISPDALA